MGVLGAVVDVIQHHVLDGHPALVGVGLRNIAAHRVEERLDVVLFVDRDDFVANGVVRRVQEIASATSIISPSLSSAGTTPEVDKVTRRLERPKPKSSSMISIAGTTLLRFSSGSPMPIITTLVMGRAAGGLHRADDLRRAPDLADNFGYPQVAVKALLGGGAEFALQRAAYREETHRVARSSSGI